MVDSNTNRFDYSLDSRHFHNVENRYGNFSWQVTNALKDSLYWVIQILENTWNETSDDLWLHSGGEITQEWYLLNWETFDWIDNVIKLTNWTLAVVYKYQDKVFWIHATKIANELKKRLWQQELEAKKEEELKLKKSNKVVEQETENETIPQEPEMIDKTFVKNVKVRSIVDLKTWKIINKLFDIERYIIENSKEDIKDGNYFESESSEALEKLYRILSK